MATLRRTVRTPAPARRRVDDDVHPPQAPPPGTADATVTHRGMLRRFTPPEYGRRAVPARVPTSTPLAATSPLCLVVVVAAFAVGQQRQQRSTAARLPQLLPSLLPRKVLRSGTRCGRARPAERHGRKSRLPSMPAAQLSAAACFPPQSGRSPPVGRPCPRWGFSSASVLRTRKKTRTQTQPPAIGDARCSPTQSIKKKQDKMRLRMKSLCDTLCNTPMHG